MRIVLVLISLLLLAAGAAAEMPADAVQQVTEAETGFARTMADRNHQAFGDFVAEDAVFFRGDGTFADVTAASGIGHLKAAMDVVGLYGYLPRSPMPIPTDEERAAIEKAIEESELFEKDEDGQWIEIGSRIEA